MIAAVSSAAQRTRQREHRENTRREILAAADSFLRERPYRDLSVEIVMAQTGLTRTAFYRHFDDVPDLVLRLLEELSQELYAVAASWLEAVGEDFPAAAQRGLAGIVHFFARHGPLLRAVSEAAVTDERIERGYDGLLESFTEMTAHGFDALIERGQVDPFNTGEVARALNLMNERYLLDRFGREPSDDTSAVVQTLERVWLGSVGALRPPRAG